MKYNRIKEVLKEKGKNQVWLAKQLDKSYNMINSYVQNRRQPSISILFNISKILKIDPTSLLINLFPLPSFNYDPSGKYYDDIEIHPIIEENGVCDRCKEGEESYWSVYLHIRNEGIECIADLKTKRQANEFASLIAKLLFNEKSNVTNIT